ncbi:hypothetical protein [Streptomyces rimosus]|uniref:hypothetical protein n=1 Tax=Streptomyces rimosus TaxID=1927 RepID=UPI00131C204C|nr:hypothetical protein [Streptomyces rimosus]
MPVTTVADDLTGKQLADSLLRGVGNEKMRAATRLLGAHRNGYWLRRLLKEEGELQPTTLRSVIDRSGTHPSVDWDSIELLLTPGCPALPCSSSELAMLEVATSMATRYRLPLAEVIHAVDHREYRLILKALEEAAFGEMPVWS